MISGSRTGALTLSTAKLLEASIARSRTSASILEAVSVLQASFSSSTFLRLVKYSRCLYPTRLWRPFDLLNTLFASSFISRIGIFHPLLIFPLVYLAFVAVSNHAPSPLALLSILIGIGSFALGYHLSGPFAPRRLRLEDRTLGIGIAFLALGTVALLYDLFQPGSIPLLEPIARRRLNVTFTMLSTLIVPGGILIIAAVGDRLKEGRLSREEARMYSITAMLVTTFLVSLLGYRTQVIVSLLGCSIAMYYKKVLGAAEIVLTFLVAVSAIASLGYYRSLKEGSSLGPLGVIGGRTALTLSVYDYLISRFWLFGVNHGSVALATFSSFFPFIPGSRLGPRTIVANIFGISGVSVTSTLFGTVVLDFGIPGIIAFALALGFVVGLAYRTMRAGSNLGTGIFSLFMAYTLVGIETGLVDFNVFTFFFLGTIILLASRGS